MAFVVARPLTAAASIDKMIELSSCQLAPASSLHEAPFASSTGVSTLAGPGGKGGLPLAGSSLMCHRTAGAPPPEA